MDVEKVNGKVERLAVEEEIEVEVSDAFRGGGLDPFVDGGLSAAVMVVEEELESLDFWAPVGLKDAV